MEVWETVIPLRLLASKVHFVLHLFESKAALLSKCRVHHRWHRRGRAAAVFPPFYPASFGIRDGVLCRDTILEVALKEDRYGKEITSVSCVALFTAGFTGDARLIGAHALRGIWSPRVGSVRHATPREPVRAHGLCDHGYKIPLHMTVKGLSVL